MYDGEQRARVGSLVFLDRVTLTWGLFFYLLSTVRALSELVVVIHADPYSSGPLLRQQGTARCSNLNMT